MGFDSAQPAKMNLTITHQGLSEVEPRNPSENQKIGKSDTANGSSAANRPTNAPP
jgi:hypothetical protein